MPARGPLRTRCCAADPRFSFSLVLPRRVRPRGLLVAVHDSDRQVERFARGFARFAREHGLAVLAPLFPADVLGDGNDSGYKFLLEGDIRYDRVLNAMVDQVARDTGCPAGGLLLHGYSGGAQFVHRYWLLHAERIKAAVVGAPGEVTLLDDELPWWGGVADTPERFGRGIDRAALRRAALCLVVGEHDTATDELREQPPSRYWPSEPARRAANRIDRLATLSRSLVAAGVHTRFRVLRGATHEAGLDLAIARARLFFTKQLGRR